MLYALIIIKRVSTVFWKFVLGYISNFSNSTNIMYGLFIDYSTGRFCTKFILNCWNYGLNLETTIFTHFYRHKSTYLTWQLNTVNCQYRIIWELVPKVNNRPYASCIREIENSLSEDTLTTKEYHRNKFGIIQEFI